jgi:hypothetical protein
MDFPNMKMCVGFNGLRWESVEFFGYFAGSVMGWSWGMEVKISLNLNLQFFDASSTRWNFSISISFLESRAFYGNFYFLMFMGPVLIEIFISFWIFPPISQQILVLFYIKFWSLKMQFFMNYWIMIGLDWNEFYKRFLMSFSS